MKSKEQIISDMCYTFRHDYGIIKTDWQKDPLSSGMTETERKALYMQMEQIFDFVIMPNFQAPYSDEHQEKYTKMSIFYQDQLKYLENLLEKSMDMNKKLVDLLSSNKREYT